MGLVGSKFVKKGCETKNFLIANTALSCCSPLLLFSVVVVLCCAGGGCFVRVEW